MITKKTTKKHSNKKFRSEKSRKPLNKNLRIIPLGGLEEIGRNMTVFEMGNDIIIVDCGLMFPDEEMMGIDYIIPNIEYLEKRKKNIRGIIITHGHFDHIGAIPHIAPRLGNPPIYATDLTKALILRRQEDYKENTPLNLKTVRKIDRITLGAFQVEFFHVNHSIPDSVGLAIRTPIGTIMHTGDFKFDHSPVGDVPADISKIARLGSEGILALMSDSTDSQSKGYSISESKIQENLDEIFAKSKGRVITATFSSLVSRVQQIAIVAEKHGRKLAVDGYSMRNTVEIARKLGYINARSSTFIDIKDVNKYPDSKIAILCTGAQGESNAVMMRIINGEHRYVQIHHGDTIIFSSSVIPGNERTIQGLKDTLFKKGAEVIHYKMMDIHAGGHARQEDLKMMINLVRPKYLIPIHGTFCMLKTHAGLGEQLGMKPQNTLVGDNGQVFEFDFQGNGKLTPEKVPSSYVMVDGLGVGDVGNVVLRDRKLLAEDGMFTITVIIDKKKREIIGEPQVTSRGFIYVKENFDLVNATKRNVKKIIINSTSKDADPNWDYIKKNIRDDVGQFLFQKTQRRPMILPVVIEV
ncbi:MAG: ribonuclease J [Patescibacteria group bacterium]|jgi:ribonuclease J|nr:ribonuclease J [Patescibacteria group bacterium]